VLRALLRLHPYEHTGYAFLESSTPSRAGRGRVGALPRPVTLREFAQRMAAAVPGTPGGLRIAGDPERIVRTVAVCGESGGSLLDAAGRAGADVVVTTDLPHCAASEAVQRPGPALCDAAPFAAQWPWALVAADLLRRDLGARVQTSVWVRRTDPWTWQVGGGYNDQRADSARRYSAEAD
jgi:hypothetical protein